MKSVSFRQVFLCVLTLALVLSPLAVRAFEPRQAPAAPQAARPGSGPWREGCTLVLLGDGVTPSEARSRLEAGGMQVALEWPPRAVFGWLARGAEVDPAIGDAHTAPIDPARLAEADPRTLAAVAFFNHTLSADQQAYISAQGDEHPLLDDAREPPAADLGEIRDNLAAVGVDPGALRAAGNSDRMVGTVAVNVFLVESNGAIDTNTYTWTEAAMQSTLNQIGVALAWWASQAALQGQALSFSLNVFSASSPACQTGYEPVLHSSREEGLWIGQILNNLGYTSGMWTSRVIALNSATRVAQATDWAYSAFICYNPPPALPWFADGYAAWAYWGGPSVSMLYRTFSLPASVAIAHETGHIFRACDEYYQPGYGGCVTCGVCTGTVSGNGNGNCEKCNPLSVDCMMKGNDWALCSYTVHEVGWDTVAPTPSATRTRTSTSTQTATATPSRTPSPTRTRTTTATPSPTSTPSRTPSSTRSPTTTRSATATPSRTATATPSATATHTPSVTRQPSRTPRPSPTWVPGAVRRARIPAVAINLSVPPASTPTPTPSATAGGVRVLANGSMYGDSLSWLHVVGEVYNGSPQTVRAAQVRVRFLNDLGQPVGEAAGYVGLDALSPGHATCFHAISGPLEGAASYEIGGLDYWTDVSVPPTLSVLDVVGDYNPSLGSYHLAGQLRNDSGVRVEDVRVAGTLYDAQGRVGGCEFGPAANPELQPGAQSLFALAFLWRDYADVVSFRVQAEGRPR